VNIGIFGLSGSGKSTVFSLLTGVKLDPAVLRKDGVVATALVHDPRVDELAKVFRPRKTTYASLTFTDMPGFDPEASRNEKTRVMQFIQNSDALLCVVRAFASISVPWPLGSETPVRQLETITSELILRDLGVVENRLERIAEAEHKHRRLTEDESRERNALGAIRQILEDGQLVSQQELSPRERQLTGSLGLFTAKPVIIAVNIDEAQLERSVFPDRDAVREQCARNGFALIELSGRLETEIGQLADGDREVFLKEYGFSETGVQRLSRVVYQHVGLISFLTVGDDEVRAWTVRRDTCARDAAGAIHSRLAKTFIRAEVIPYETFMTVRDLNTARSRSLIRLAGRDEFVRDGDIFHVRAGG
jgi:GTP-binding protein YchF